MDKNLFLELLKAKVISFSLFFSLEFFVTLKGCSYIVRFQTANKAGILSTFKKQSTLDPSQKFPKVSHRPRVKKKGFFYVPRTFYTVKLHRGFWAKR